jgi:hypothetical protein
VDRVVPAVHVQVQAGDDEVLVKRRVGALVDQCPGGRLLAVREVRGDHDAGRAHLALDAAVLVEPPVDEVLVVGHGDVERHHQPPRREPPAVADPPLAAQHGSHLAELRGRQRIQRMRHGVTPS